MSIALGQLRLRCRVRQIKFLEQVSGTCDVGVILELLLSDSPALLLRTEAVIHSRLQYF